MNAIYYALSLWPDHPVEGADAFDLRRIGERLRPMRYVIPAVHIGIIDARAPQAEGGVAPTRHLVAYVRMFSADKGAISEPLVMKRLLVLDEPARFPSSSREASIAIAAPLTATKGYWIAAHVNAGTVPRYARTSFGWTICYRPRSSPWLRISYPRGVESAL